MSVTRAVAVGILAACLVYGGVQLAVRGDAAGMNADAMSIDMDPGATPANTGTSFGTIESCARINENDLLDADEDATDTLNIDVVIDNIPAGTAAITTNFVINFLTPGVTVTQNATPYASAHGWSIINASDGPQSDGSYLHSVVDLSIAGTTGSGAIGSLTFETASGVATGEFSLTLTGAAHIDGTNTAYAPDTINNATVAINQDCGLTPPATPTPPITVTPPPTPPGGSATPTPTASGSPGPSDTPTPTEDGSATPTPTPVPALAGDLDCDGDVSATDALKGLQFVAGIPFQQEPDCPPIGVASLFPFGDIDCDDDVDAVDSLQILRFIAGLPVIQANGCPDIGGPL